MATATAAPVLEVCFLRNEGKAEFVGTYNNQRYVIAAGAERAVPTGAIKCWFGDARTIDDDARGVHDRSQELRRMAIKYGHDMVEEMFEAKSRNVPKVSARTLDGAPIALLINDPAAVVAVQEAPALDTQDVLLSAVRERDETIDALMRRVEALEGRPPTETGSTSLLADLPPDVPVNAPRPKPQKQG